MKNFINAGKALKDSFFKKEESEESKNQTWVVERWTLDRINSPKNSADREILKAFETEKEANDYVKNNKLKLNDRQTITVRMHDVD
jgi:hypothetical protein